MAQRTELRPRKKVAFANFYAGFTFNDGLEFVLRDVIDDYAFEQSSTPEFLIYGPYGGDLPEGDYVRIFYGCENVRPDMTECDWAFGVEHEEFIGHPKYMRLLWGPPPPLVKDTFDRRDPLENKTRFCNFIFSNRVVFREQFFKALSRYKRVDAPGLSMNNMPRIPKSEFGDWQNEKVQFLNSYKFTIAFENSSAPGYNTEKLVHPMLARSVPIYWGDPVIEREFDTRSFINTHGLVPCRPKLPRLPVRSKKYFPLIPDRTFKHRLYGRLNRVVRDVEMRIAAVNAFDAVIERVIAADEDDEVYRSYFAPPYFRDNRPPDRTRYANRWRQIFQ